MKVWRIDHSWSLQSNGYVKMEIESVTGSSKRVKSFQVCYVRFIVSFSFLFFSFWWNLLFPPSLCVLSFLFLNSLFVRYFSEIENDVEDWWVQQVLFLDHGAARCRDISPQELFLLISFFWSPSVAAKLYMFCTWFNLWFRVAAGPLFFWFHKDAVLFMWCWLLADCCVCSRIHSRSIER